MQEIVCLPAWFIAFSSVFFMWIGWMSCDRDAYMQGKIDEQDRKQKEEEHIPTKELINQLSERLNEIPRGTMLTEFEIACHELAEKLNKLKELSK